MCSLYKKLIQCYYLSRCLSYHVVNLFLLPASGLTLEVLSGVDVTPTDVREHGIRCACGIEVDSGLMVHCKFCNHWQHGVSVTYVP
jgi:hypothetical protein